LILVVDASVLMKWFAAEELSDEADLLRPLAQSLAAPDFLLIEMTTIVWTKVRRGQLDGAPARQVVPSVRRSGIRLIPSEALLAPALELALELQHSPYDCLYVAAMELRDARLVTWDKTLFRRLATTRFANRAYLLSDVERLLADVARAP
jgi:predicted nucleic acid-binding protein